MPTDQTDDSNRQLGEPTRSERESSSISRTVGSNPESARTVRTTDPRRAGINGPSTRSGPKQSASSPVGKGKVQLVERTILVRLIPRTSRFARVRAVVVLAIIAGIIGLLLAGAIGLTVWGLAAAVHHAANN